ncbi:MAG: TIGR00282 family metallophosphoesterase [Clostridiales bacterium]|nr:TIGR00282 family metallophosphoesterase [Clostridiales bacterium]
MIRICFVGDVVGEPGRRMIKNVLPSFTRDNSIDLTIVNGENAAHGLGITAKICDEFFECGVDVITLGNHTFSSYDFLSMIEKYDNVIRPGNMGKAWPGKGTTAVKGVGVMNLMGQVGMQPCGDNPFDKADEYLDMFEKENVRVTVCDIHAEATSEKQAVGFYLDGRASLVVGTHTHVMTADSRVLNGGTGYITDLGMTGCIDSVIGMDILASLKRLKEKIPARYEPARGDAFMNGIIAEIDESTGICKGIRRFTEYE